MTAQDLKNSILQLAVQGKLVPQNAEDESASELIKHIRDERLSWIAEGRIKKEKPLSAIKEDEITTELPDSWVWCRVGEVFVIVRGITFPSEAKNTVSASGLVPCATTGSVQDTYNYNADVFVSEQFVKRNDQWLLPNDIIMSTANSRELVGKTCIWTSNERKTFGGFLTVLRPGTGILPKYAYYALMSIKASGAFLKTATQTTNIANINTTVLQNTLFPLPPVNEQERIVAKIEELVPLVAKYDEAEKKLSTLNADFPEMLRKSILQQAVQGKLAARDASDEPASELLKRIRAEKAKLVVEGKGKADKPYAPITDDELPFNLPDGWAAIRIGELGFYRKGPFGSSLTKQMFVPEGPNTVKVYEQKNAIQKDCRLGDYYITRDYFESKMKGFEVFPGDIIVSCAGTIGESYVMPNGCEQGIINQALMRMKIVDAMNLDYFLLYFDYVLKASAQKNSKGAAIKNIPPFEILKNMIMPLPPVEEQKRILEQVNKMLTMCDGLQ